MAAKLVFQWAYQECLDAGREPEDWKSSGFRPDTSWAKAYYLGPVGIPPWTSMEVGAGIVSVISRYMLGCRPVTPGWEEFEFSPMPGRIKKAEGTVPTPKGCIRVGWEVKGGILEAVIDIPEGISARVSKPNIHGLRKLA